MKQYFNFTGKKFLLLPFFFLPLKSFAQLKTDKTWLRLLAYKKVNFNYYESYFDTPKYFFHSEGKDSPQKELDLTIKKLNIKNVCDYPARYLYLKKRAIKFDFNLDSCKEYQFYLKQVDLESVWLAFASYYIKNPGSAFGHTFLKFRSKDRSKGAELLDFAVDYSADTPQNANSFLYSIKGLLGGYKANYKITPYYKKVREYNDKEARDIWEYEIPLTQSQKNFLLAILWEQKKVNNNYYFFSENCSFHILRLLETLFPNKNIIKDLDNIVVPIETVALLRKNKILNKVKYRPSIQTHIFHQLKKLSNKELDDLEKLREDHYLNKNFTVKTYDTFLDFYDKENFESLYDKNSKAWKEKQNFLIKRTKMPLNPNRLKEMKKEDPSLAHKRKRLTFSMNEEEEFLAEIRMAFHDFTDPSFGHAKGYSLNMGELKLRYKDHIRVDKASLLSIASLNPMNRFYQDISWNMALGLEDNRVISFGSGLTFESNLGLTYLSLQSNLYSYRGLFKKIDFSLAPALLQVYNFKKIQGIASLRRDYLLHSKQKKWNYDLSIYWNMKDSALGISLLQKDIEFKYRLYF